MNSTPKQTYDRFLDRLLHFDRVPLGTYFSPSLDPDVQRRAVAKRTIEMGAEIAVNHPEIAEFYRKTDYTYLEIARTCIPDIAEKYPTMASKAVGHAMRQLIPEDEQAKLTAHRRRLNLERIIDVIPPEEQRKIWQEAWRKRHEMYGTDVEAMVKARGRVMWSDNEKLLLAELSNNQEYQHQSGSHKGNPNYELIALELNITFHDCAEVRSGTSVGNYMRDVRRIKRKRKA